MSRETPVSMTLQSAGASAGTTYLYFPIPVPFRFEAYAWSYQTAEANTDNTVKFAITRDIDADGSFDNASDAVQAAPTNAMGLLNTGAIGMTFTNKNNSGSGGGAATTNAITPCRLAAGEAIRISVVRAGTGTVPAVNFTVYGKWLQPIV